MKSIIFVLIVSLFSGSLQAQDSCACCSESYTYFDFWVGDWVVYDTMNNVVGENTIAKLEDNCIVSEHWRGAQGGSGRAYSYYNKADSLWHQVWIDSNGWVLSMKGSGNKNQMVLESEMQSGQIADNFFHRGTWEKVDENTVTQHWEIIGEKGEILQSVFYGIYKRK
jgi:hypothetical protein